jgi:tetratricopeptide (TPR) repeat protein
MEGYREYIRQTNNIEELVRLAKQYYTAAYYLSDEGKHEAAIAKYTLAIELIPSFFEAIDNRAFSKMDMGRWEDAIADFELSLKVEPNSVLAEFSIGECYLRLRDAKKAIAQFEKVLALDPDNVKGKEFLARAKAL